MPCLQCRGYGAIYDTLTDLNPFSIEKGIVVLQDCEYQKYFWPWDEKDIDIFF